ncbi:MAG: hypothetical protein IBJ19_02145 [Gemmatimonadaceae bacterium]|jgi:hypothetical protein|nr:hypothetical protein [Gemmatimonadaceae bacterium]
MVSYGMTAGHYLARARLRLAEGTHEGLFYAAFELRCGIESRLREYLRALDNVSEKKRNGWKVAQLASDLEAVFGMGDRYVEIGVLDPDTGRLLRAFYYTPVTGALRQAAERLGDYLHAMKRYRLDADPYWAEMQTFLVQVADDLSVATRGTLMGPPMLDERRQLKMTIEVPGSDGAPDISFARPGTKAVLGVRYHDAPPEGLIAPSESG